MTGDQAPAGDTAAAPARLTVSELNRSISRALTRAFPEELWVVGEVSNLRERNGTRYFDLVEPDDSGRRNLAQLPATVLRWERAAFDADLARAAGFELTDGVEVLVRGAVDLYEPWGRVQFKVRGIDPEHTLGRLRLAREELLADLAERGVLRANAARAVTTPPLRVGLVTAPGSQAEHDLRAVLAGSGWGFTLIRAGARVQGPQCEAEVAAALGRLAALHARQPLDVVVVIRGGGSALDLQGFDTAGVARAIVEAPFPVWTGIGHEQDGSVADAVAHTAWPTPTAVGRGLADAVDGADDRVTVAAEELTSATRRRLDASGTRLDQLAGSLSGSVRAPLRAAWSALQVATTALGQLAGARVRRADHDLEVVRQALLRSAPRAALPGARERLDQLEGGVARAARHRVAAATGRLELAEARLDALDPAVQLARGYSITRDADGRVVRRLTDAPVGAQLRTQLTDGTVTSRVDEHRPEPAPASPQRTSGQEQP